ncbi:MAG: FkbM family methyltransferase [Anaerolineae bacterium]
MKAQRVRLPNGMEVYSKRKEEALLMYSEVGDYVRHGLSLQPGATVLDVGANIGMFSLWAYEQCHGDIDIYAFEPLPPIFEMLAANFALLNNARLHALACGLSHQPGTMQFAYYPNATFASTAYPDTAAAELELTSTLLERNLQTLPAPLSAIEHFPAFIRHPAVQMIARYINQRKTVTCELKTLSQIIGEHGLERVDFLKIDAEKSELDVLNGIEPAHWELIQQVFIEVHNRDNRLHTIEHMLKAHGFTRVIAEQDPFFAGTDIHAMYASR